MTIWRNRDFRWFWAGQSVSMVGSQVTTFAVPVLAITALGADPARLGLLRAVEFLPFLVLTLPAGLWVDRHPPRPAMIAANLLRAALVAAVALAGIAGVLHLTGLAVALLLIGAATVVFDVAYLSYLPVIAGRDQLVDGNSRLSVSASVADVAGPGLAGGLVQVLTAPVTLLLDAASYLISAGTLLAIRTPDTPPPGTTPRAGTAAPHGTAVPRRAVVSPARQVRDGVAVVARDPYLRTICLESFTYNFFVQFGETLVALYALTVLGLTAGTLGLCIGAGSLGGLAGAVLAPRAVRRFGFGPTFTGGTALGCAAPVLVPLAGAGAGASPLAAGALIAAAYLITGFGVTISVIGSVTLRQGVAPPHLLGRVNAVMRLASYAAIPLGAAVTGVVATAFGVRTGLFVGAAGLLLPTVILLLSPVPRLKGLLGVVPSPASGVEDDHKRRYDSGS
ncbi:MULTISPECIES: MFS transporter [Catenuloplanes]|uniref:Na+/melibiose symporter-like transporter n=1 Tax=Catenuloplanes niger TaxID=587534 RepID=A0AAE4CQ18_9ACTN|nr:MFS transporter [Catenuloplanes niger]MDR7320022.1 Na+/melibiose symporter-like transporter [Catenuloplanes niger]